jgi:hypothetical protein
MHIPAPGKARPLKRLGRASLSSCPEASHQPHARPCSCRPSARAGWAPPQGPETTLTGIAYRPDALASRSATPGRPPAVPRPSSSRNGIATAHESRRIAYTGGALRHCSPLWTTGWTAASGPSPLPPERHPRRDARRPRQPDVRRRSRTGHIPGLRTTRRRRRWAQPWRSSSGVSGCGWTRRFTVNRPTTWISSPLAPRLFSTMDSGFCHVFAAGRAANLHQVIATLLHSQP